MKKSRLLPLLLVLSWQAGCVAGIAGSDPLANGLSGDVMTTAESSWTLVDGELVPHPADAMGFVYTRRVYDDFELTLEVFPVGPTNSGIFVRCADAAKINPMDCYEFNIWDSHANPEFRTGSVVMISAPQADVATEDRWNRIRVRVDGERLQMWVNGVQTNDVTDDRYRSGHIAFQYGGSQGMVRFRNIRIVELD